jgi:hypothetical protein
MNQISFRGKIIKRRNLREMYFMKKRTSKRTEENQNAKKRSENKSANSNMNENAKNYEN